MGIIGNLSSDQLDSFNSQGKPKPISPILKTGFLKPKKKIKKKPFNICFIVLFSFCSKTWFFNILISCLGFFVLESFASPEEIDAMMKRMEQLLHEFDCSSTTSFLSTKNQVLYSILINQFDNFEFFF